MSDSAGSRGLSAFEFLLGAGIVIGHNVFRILPNEVPILVVLGLLSMRLRNGGWATMGFKRPSSWTFIIGIALIAAAVRIVLGDFVILPLTGQFWPEPIDPAGSDDITGNIQQALLWLLIVWGFAAFGEEIAYRGYLLNRAADVGGRTPAAFWISMVLVSVLFGYGHYYKGPAGIIDSGIAGLILGTAYLVTGRNLWTCILAHGFIDTVRVMAEFLGFDS